MKNWLSEELLTEVRMVFEPKYQRPISEDELISIAESLTKVMELIAKNVNEKEIRKFNKREQLLQT